jgi:precorrin-6Y C5,15-methyltransferase (decarboxylating)
VPEKITVIGIGADATCLAPRPAAALQRADLVAGGREHLLLAPSTARTLVLGADLGSALEAIAAEPGAVCVLASGDPGFFGILRPLAERFGRACLEVHPAPSSVAVAFGRLGMCWDDAVVISAHGRRLEDAVAVARQAPKAAVLTSPTNPPEALGKALLATGARNTHVAVCSRLGSADEAIVETNLEGLAAGSFDARSVVVLLAGEAVPRVPTLSWGRPEAAFAHCGGMITKAEVRAIVLGKLGIPARGVLWDIGAGSASVAIEAAGLAQDLEVFAIERDETRARQAQLNAKAHGVALSVVVGEAPAALAGLPDPHRAFVGGGGLEVLSSVLERLAPGGRVVATYAALDRAAAAAERLGNLVEVSVARGERLADGGMRLAAQNPVFVVWGPEP